MAFNTSINVRGRVTREPVASASAAHAVVALSEIEACEKVIAIHDRNKDVVLTRDTTCTFNTDDGLCRCFKTRAALYCDFHLDPAPYGAAISKAGEFHRGAHKIAETRTRLASLKAAQKAPK